MDRKIPFLLAMLIVLGPGCRSGGDVINQPDVPHLVGGNDLEQRIIDNPAMPALPSANFGEDPADDMIALIVTPGLVGVDARIAVVASDVDTGLAAPIDRVVQVLNENSTTAPIALVADIDASIGLINRTLLSVWETGRTEVTIAARSRATNGVIVHSRIVPGALDATPQILLLRDGAIWVDQAGATSVIDVPVEAPEARIVDRISWIDVYNRAATHWNAAAGNPGTLTVAGVPGMNWFDAHTAIEATRAFPRGSNAPEPPTPILGDPANFHFADPRPMPEVKNDVTVEDAYLMDGDAPAELFGTFSVHLAILTSPFDHDGSGASAPDGSGAPPEGSGAPR